MYTVSGSITAIIASPHTGVDRRSDPIASATPVTSSSTDSATAPTSTASRGTPCQPHTARYSCILITNPHGSVHFAQPDTANVAPVASRSSHTAAVFTPAGIPSA